MDSIELLMSAIFILVALILGSVGYFVRKRTIGNCSVEVVATISDLDWTKGLTNSCFGWKNF
ncbi:MAG: hypothetical protein KBT48_01680 [Firmicutes bacterium]|nr:hypothetical protein [Bacillota bacterium]